MWVDGQRHAPAALPPEKTRYPLYRRLGGPHGRSGLVRKISTPPGFDPQTVQSVASRYTDWATPAHSPPYSVVKQIFVVSHQIRPVWQYPLDTKGINPLKPELNPICYLLALLGAHHFIHVSRIRVKLLTFRLLMSYIYGAPILDVSRSHTTTQHSR